MRTLLTGWFSFVEGEATAGDVLSAETVARVLKEEGVPHDVAWSPVFRPDALHLDEADPADYTHLVFACGPLHSLPPRPGATAPLLWLHQRFAGCRRIAVGVSVPDPDDPAVTGFDVVLARDGPGVEPAVDLSVHAPRAAGLPLIGVVTAHGQGEYRDLRRHEQVNADLDAWLCGLDVARLPLETRLDRGDWRLPGNVAQLERVIRACDAVVTSRLHGLVLALRGGVPALAVDPVAGGAKVTAQAQALGWPAILPADRVHPPELDRMLGWCLSPQGRQRARENPPTPGHDLLDALCRRLTG
ncbi:MULTISPECIES: polysaccharide pyruvyl transferase family protein [Streptomycetaceae]|uniref:Polysaccharide pyruvyl transferase n=1 Tax=Streptantibioticus cattleyicolor (strain ATCC 35852 / DSM 46488 / JCM 4925 / NBRC 14057 / NRRL 8057) TaxID=1003195 RepID=F8K2K3_STREN|nr:MULTISPECIES: polysaccharide pyruvyl transferase family protein [Streptomycetaceae]AEW97514.1 Polysaccharide pyruvyl transferase [Streptantibioticus cattleyicolor NRRL 8057 = DSM 46488]MYS61947.1 polysaccharide pyruvyl transferase family protein [Streptomyces sp. SID5468]CCB77838.1 conserved protein of unknown function [Streptantibioticus cattleyicolor NRRL 8057 = DSM 46488]